MKMAAKSGSSDDGLTAQPNHSLTEFLNIKTFEQFLRSPMGKHTFRKYLKTVMAEENLDFWYKVFICDEQVSTLNLW